MPRDYTWSRRTIGRNKLCIGELGTLLGVGRHQARRLLLQSGLPCRLITRRWRDSDGSWYSRRTYAIPPATAETLLWQAIEREWKKDVRLVTRLGGEVPLEARTPPSALFGR